MPGIGETSRDRELDELLAEQVAYYRARAPEYLESTLADVFGSEIATARGLIATALDALAPLGDVLELACGPGTFTAELARRATTVLALDASPEMLAIAADLVPDPKVSFEQADVFTWRAAHRFDVVFFGFWISHVPLERFEQFFATVAGALKSDGRVVFVDDAYRTPDELVEGEASSTIRRRLGDGTQFRAVKVAHEPALLERRLAALGWRIAVQPLSGPFFWGSGSRG